MKVKGAAFALSLTYFINLGLLEIFVRRSAAFAETYVTVDKQAFERWGEYLEVGWYSAVLESLSWWNLHICFLFSGYLGVNEAAA